MMTILELTLPTIEQMWAAVEWAMALGILLFIIALCIGVVSFIVDMF